MLAHATARTPASVPSMKRALGHGLSAELPDAWAVRETEDLIEAEPPSREGAVHITVLRRTLDQEPDEGEATALIEHFPTWRDAAIRGDIATVANGTAFGTCIAADGAHWDVGAKVARERALVFSYNAGSSLATEREEAATLFLSLDGLDRR